MRTRQDDKVSDFRLQICRNRMRRMYTRACAKSPSGPHPLPLSLTGRGEIPHQDASDSPSPAQGEGAGGEG